MKKGKKIKLRFNVIDFIIIIIVVGCIAGIVYRYNLVDRLIIDSKKDTMQVHFVAFSVSKELEDKLSVGDEFYLEGSGELLGTLKSSDSSDAVMIVSDENGKPVISYNKELKDIQGIISCSGVKRDNGFFIAGTKFIAPGSELVLESINVRISVIITEIS